jgi:hypothetical protein
LKIAEAAAPRDLGRFPALQRRLATAVLEYIQVGGGWGAGVYLRLTNTPSTPPLPIGPSRRQPDSWECLLHVSTFATTRVALPTGVKAG